MASRKRSRQGDQSSPNVVLVIFLVIFMLATFGMGGWVYSIFDQKKKWEEDASKAKQAEAAALVAIQWAKGTSAEARIAQGAPIFKDDKTDELAEWKGFREFLEVEDDGKVKDKDPSKFNNFPDRATYLKAVEQYVKDLGWNKASGTYKTNYADKFRELEKKLTDLQKSYAALDAKYKAKAEEFASLDTRYKAEREKLLAEIKTASANALQAVADKAQAITTDIDNLRKERDDVDKLRAKHKAETTKMALQIEELRERLTSQGGDKGGKGPATAPAGSQHALLLDISKGKTLWDRPVGKITRINERERQVTIDKGQLDGVRPHLAFNIFAAGWDGKAEGPFKGTIEVIRADQRSSVARITSLYDRDGNEILLNDPSPTRLLREGSNALKEGDLIFHLGWGSHVAVAGVVDFNGLGATAAAAQQDDLEQFLQVLRSQGVVVDAYVDLRDGQIRGKLTPKTQFLIRGFPVYGGDPKTPDPRQQAVNGALNELRKEALDRGHFIISPENFLHVVGYRRPRSKLDLEISAFRPAMPGAAGGDAPVVKGDAPPVTELSGRWVGKLSGGGQLRLTFKGDGGCVWQMIVGADSVSGFTNVTRVGSDFSLVIQNRPATARLVGAGTGLQVTGQNLEATLTRE